jgi:hypothetical protein
VPDRTPDEGALDRARLEAGTMSMFGAHLTVLRQPLKAAGRSTTAADRLLAVIKSAEGVIAGLQLCGEDASEGLPPVRVTQFLDRERKGIPRMEIRKEVDVVFEDFRQRHDVSGRESRIDPALIEAIADRAVDDAGLANEWNLLTLR